MKTIMGKITSLIPLVVYLVNYESCRDAFPDVWKHGPEYIFHVDVNSSMLIPENGNYLCSNVTILLSCREIPQAIRYGPEGLQCYVKNAKITNYKVNTTNKSREIVENDDKATSPFEIGANKFEILYDKKGIKEFRYEPPLSRWSLNMLRAVANQLNIGFDRFDKGGERFALVEVVGNENSTIGECETEFHVSKQTADIVKHWNTTKCDNKMHLVTAAYGETNPIIAIDKKRFTNKCSKSTPYVFGAKEIMRDESASTRMKMTSSVTSFIVGPYSFQSQTRNTAIENTTNSTLLVSYEEAVDLLLVSIEPAQDELKTISNPAVTTIFAYAPTST